MLNGVLEVCVDSYESAEAAVRGGATRLELCSNLVIGGTTPGMHLFQKIKTNLSIPVNVLIRPRFGDFLYTDSEFQIISEDVKAFHQMGADGVVVGCLDPEGDLDMERMMILREMAGDGTMTLHRAFDLCRDPHQALREAESIGIDTILTSGQKNHCMDGRNLLKELIRESADRVHILVGSGVTPEVINCLADEIGARYFHMSGKKIIDSGMKYRKEQVNMGMPGMSEYEIYRTDEEQVRRARKIMNQKCGEIW